MPVIENNPACCGCSACSDICPVSAISMKCDSETFVYPVIDHQACIQCGLCQQVCPLHFDGFQDVSPTALVGVYKSGTAGTGVPGASSSGGTFTALCEIFISRGYVVYGASYEDHFRVAHTRAETLEDCRKFRKSKYLQSDAAGCYRAIAQDLQAGRKVLFSGVSCQCAALSSYLQTKKIKKELVDNLITVNILCHGVPSQKLFDMYLAEEEKAEGSTVRSYQFKNKLTAKDIGRNTAASSGNEIGKNTAVPAGEDIGKSAPASSGKGSKNINTRTALVTFANGRSRIRTIADDPYLRGYYGRLFYRPSCASCLFARRERISDITLSDAWNIEKIHPEYNAEAGVSLILLNTPQAKAFRQPLCEIMDLQEVSAEWALSSQQVFYSPTDVHPKRNHFFQLLAKNSFRESVYRCIPLTRKEKLQKLVPAPLYQGARSLLKR